APKPGEIYESSVSPGNTLASLLNERTIIECAEQNALTQLGLFKDNGMSEDAMDTLGEIDKRARMAMRDMVTPGAE
ncbi:hypothetical protein, partial [Larsenimonas rhizosphaerae]|uniref:hypothetical protein n=1 Tax=Larsenimonas rhizosphaerae TaxID=2944682 RepID=UPI0020345751